MNAGVVTIPSRGLSWQVEIATTSSERTQGLGGRASLDALNGMLFDMGSNQSQITINMREMLFLLDIVFFDEDMVVRGMVWELNPTDIEFNATFPEGPGARYFLEVNAGELLESVEAGDQGVITGWEPPAPPTPPIEIGSIIELMVPMMIVMMMMGMMSKMMKGVSGPAPMTTAVAVREVALQR